MSFEPFVYLVPMGPCKTSFELGIADPGQCWTQCELESQCAAWTYVKPGVQGANARCWLKSSVSTQVPNVDFATSGVKDPITLRR